MSKGTPSLSMKPHAFKRIINVVPIRGWTYPFPQKFDPLSTQDTNSSQKGNSLCTYTLLNKVLNKLFAIYCSG